MGELIAYRFAASPAHARRTMAWYGSMFNDGPVLDVGAGRSYFLEVLRARGVECLGVDISEEAAVAARQLGVEIIVQDAFSFLAERSGFAGMFISHLIEHLEPVRAQELLRAAHGALRPGGTMVIVTPDPRDWLVLSEIFWLDTTHIRPYPTKLVTAMLEAAGFTVEASGNRNLDLGRRRIPGTILNRIRFGASYARGEAWIRARSGT
jgi:2-polyprenyl-3-methyl-5-hydroxy-6-metoxy-1,4-benzoquinol methylase